MRTIVGFGASSVQGVRDPEGGFMARLTQALPRRPDIRLMNLGIGGHTTRDMLQRIPAVEAIAGREVVVLLGCNDVPRANDNSPARRTTLQEYAANLRAILPASRASARSSFPPSASASNGPV
jgi:lysophospholipase L1-like esterase